MDVDTLAPIIRDLIEEDPEVAYKLLTTRWIMEQRDISGYQLAAMIGCSKAWVYAVLNCSRLTKSSQRTTRLYWLDEFDAAITLISDDRRQSKSDVIG